MRSKASSAPQSVPLADFVAGLRRELRAIIASREPDLLLAVGPVTVEFTTVTGREGGPEASVRFWVVDAGGSAKWSKEATQKVTMVLTPLDVYGGQVIGLRE